jgi:hypothetical protein
VVSVVAAVVVVVFVVLNVDGTHPSSTRARQGERGGGEEEEGRAEVEGGMSRCMYVCMSLYG